MNFMSGLKRTEKHSVLDLTSEGFYVWCGTLAKGDDGKFYLYFSFWPKEKGHDAWVTHSQVGYAVSDCPTGPFIYAGIAMCGSGGNGWDRDVIHNPTVIKDNGIYYMYYMGNYGDGTYWSHRNNQRVGVAWAKSPQGPWHRQDKPLVDITKGAHDSLLTSNPTVAKDKNGRFVMVYKAVSDKGEMPKGGAVVCGAAVADNPLGPFMRCEEPIMQNDAAKKSKQVNTVQCAPVPEANWSVEDPYIWYQNNRFYALAKDFHGYFTKAGENTMALLRSEDGLHWQADERYPLACRRQIEWEDGSTTRLDRMERPQLWIDCDGVPKVFLCACMKDIKTSDCFNVQIPCEILP